MPLSLSPDNTLILLDGKTEAILLSFVTNNSLYINKRDKVHHLPYPFLMLTLPNRPFNDLPLNFPIQRFL